MSELKNNKDALIFAERQQKDQWVKDKTQEIREHAVKGLEKEVEKIILSKKLEIKK